LSAKKSPAAQNIYTATALLAPIKGRPGHHGWTPPSSSDT
jgi:hypothetical protein